MDGSKPNACSDTTLRDAVRRAPPHTHTTCLPSSQEVCTVQMKNWEPLVLGPACEGTNGGVET